MFKNIRFVMFSFTEVRSQKFEGRDEVLVLDAGFQISKALRVTLWVFYFFFEVESTCNHP
jgi:hypothetical protein